MLGLVVALAAISWVGLAWLLFRLNVGDYDDFWFGGRVLTYILLLVAPALTFVPLGRAIGMNWFGYWTVLSWAVFGFVLAFVPSDPQTGPGHNVVPLTLLLVSLFLVLVSVFMPLCYALATRFAKRQTMRPRRIYGRAWREGIGLAGYVILMAFLRSIGSLNSFNALLLFLILVVIELLFLARFR